ncbi:MAG: hypothetical protein WA432_01390 [Candidatus Babeliaceae bacterium]
MFKKNNLLVLFPLLCIPVFVHGMMRISDGTVLKKKDISLFYDAESFYVEKDSALKKIENYRVDPKLRKISPQNLYVLLENGYLSLKELSDGNYALNGNVRGIGGGPVTAIIAMWGTRLGAWGAFAGAVWLEPAIALHVHETQVAIEFAANAAFLAGMSAPLP